MKPEKINGKPYRERKIIKLASEDLALDVVKILDSEGMSYCPVHTGFGIEVYDSYFEGIRKHLLVDVIAKTARLDIEYR